LVFWGKKFEKGKCWREMGKIVNCKDGGKTLVELLNSPFPSSLSLSIKVRPGAPFI